jgi:hypothetical protein
MRSLLTYILDKKTEKKANNEYCELNIYTHIVGTRVCAQ